MRLRRVSERKMCWSFGAGLESQVANHLRLSHLALGSILASRHSAA
jgi:hypothetical protein